MTEDIIKKLQLKFPHNPGILGKEEYFNSAVLIPLIELNEEFHFLFEKRAKKIRQGGEICFPGGEIESSDKNIEDAVFRETEEEIGIDRNKINILGRLDTLMGPRGITVDSCLGIVELNSLDECKIEKSEVEKVFSVPLSFFKNNPPEVFTMVTKSNLTFFNSKGEEENLLLQNGANDEAYFTNVRKVLVYKTSGEIIWGITARLVFEVVNMLND